MLETKILGDALGIQNQGLIDKMENTSLPAMTNGVIVGRFKRGRMDKAMVVTANNYQAVLGHDPSNPSYLALEDIFALGVNQVSVLRTGSSDKGAGSGGGAILCTPSSAYATESAVMQDSLSSKWITVSRNGGDFLTFDLINADDDVYLQFSNMTVLGQDGKSIAFVDTFMIDPNSMLVPLDDEVISSEISASPQRLILAGISSNGVISTPYGEKDLKVVGLRYPSDDTLMAGFHKPNKPRAEHNWLVFKPTPNVDPDTDMFYQMTTTGDTLEVHSCAVMEKYIDPSVCVPTYRTTLGGVRGGFENPIGQVHAKYRINGGQWVTYTDSNDDIYTSAVHKFFESMYDNDWKMIHVGGGNGEAAFATGYHQANIYGASATSEYMRDQDGIRAYQAYTIEFAVTENSPNDLVYLAFGEDTTIHSCAIGTWMGY